MSFLLLTICTCLLERFKPTAGHILHADVVPKPLDLDPYHTIPRTKRVPSHLGPAEATTLDTRVPHHLRHAQRPAAC
jgi:hypothetical protein